MAASPLPPHSLRALQLTVADALVGHSGTAALPPRYHEALAECFPAGRLVATRDAQAGSVPDVLVLEDVLDPSNTGSILARALASVRAGGEVIAQLSPQASAGLMREEVTEWLVGAFPAFSFRVVDLTTPHWVTVRTRKPVARLILGASKSGKTTSTIELSQRTGLRAIHGDVLLEKIVLGRVLTSPGLSVAARVGYDAQNWAMSIAAVFEGRHDDEFLDVVVQSARGQPFFFEMWVPLIHSHRVREYIDRQGYFTFKPDADAADQALGLEERLRHLNAEHSAAQQELKDLSTRLAERDREIAALRLSHSWRLTDPLRALSRLVRGRN